MLLKSLVFAFGLIGLIVSIFGAIGSAFHEYWLFNVPLCLLFAAACYGLAQWGMSDEPVKD